MKRIYLFFLLSALSAITPALSRSKIEHCHGCYFDRDYGFYTKIFRLYGKVRVVNTNECPDLRVFLTHVEAGEYIDMKIKWVTHNPLYCGEWQRVDSGEDFTVAFVNDPSEADFNVIYGEPREEYITADPFDD